MAMPRDVVVLSDDQFNKLVELLTPGYELAKAYLAAQQQPNAAEIEADRFDQTKETAETEGDLLPIEHAESSAVISENQHTDGGLAQGDSGDETK